MSLFTGSVLVLVGLINIKFPAFIWFFSIGWMLRDAEPSDLVLIVNRIIGYLLFIIGMCYILSIFFPGIGL